MLHGGGTLGATLLPWGVASAAVVVALATTRAWRRERTAHQVRPRAVAADASAVMMPAVFDQAAIGIALVSPEGHTVRVNRRLVELLGYAEHELLHGRLLDLTHPDDLAHSMDERARLLDGVESNTRLEKRYLHRNGQPIWVSVSVTMVPAHAGVPDLLVLVIDDIRERKAAEKALASHRAQLEELVAQRTATLDATMRRLSEQVLARTVADSMPGAVYYWDADLRCRLAHGGHLKARGLRVEEMLGRQLHELLPGDEAKDYETRLRAALAGATQAHSVSKPDGTRALATLVPDMQEGVAVGVTMLVWPMP